MVEPSGMTIQQAARELRAHLQRSQQAMATFLGLSMAALRNYESGAVAAPDARAATAYMMAAEASGRPDLVEVFGSALHRAMGIPVQTVRDSMSEAAGETLFMEPVNHFERRMVTTLLACIRGQGPFKEYQKPVLKALLVPSTFDFPESLRFLKKEELQEQLTIFENLARQKRPKPGKPRAQKERTSA